MKFKDGFFLVAAYIFCVAGILNAQVKTEDFAGTARCLSCHANISIVGTQRLIDTTAFNASFHQKQLRTPAVASLLPSAWDGVMFTVTSGSMSSDIVLSLAGGTYQVKIDGLGPYEVEYFLGGAGWKQRYITMIDSSMYILPIQNNKNTGEWVEYHLEDWKSTDGSATQEPEKTSSYDRRCSGCHTTGSEVHYNPTTEEYIVSFKEMNIGCEACHGAGGPSSTHSNYGLSATGGNPSKLTDKGRALEVCGRCHSRGTSASTLEGAPSAFGFPWGSSDRFGGFPFGGILADFFTQTTSSGDFWGDGTSKEHNQQYNDFIQSGHYSTTDETIVCFTCHDPHGGDNHQVRTSMDIGGTIVATDNDDNSLCLSCHAGYADEPFKDLTTAQIADMSGNAAAIAAAVSAHTRHTYDPTDANSTNGASRCSKCHMPKAVESAIAYDMHNHTFKPLSPQNTVTYGMPNSCATSCHRSTTGDSYGGIFDGITDVTLTNWSEASDVALAKALKFWDENWFFAARGGEGKIVNADMTSTPPAVDGDVSDSAWISINWVDIPLANNKTVSMKAIVTTTDIYIAAKWDDATMSMTRSGGWVYDETGGSWSTTSGNSEDRLAILWNVSIPSDAFAEKGCLNKCHRDVDNTNAGNDLAVITDDAYLPAGQTADMWHMKAARSLGVTSASQSGPLTIEETTYEVTAGRIDLIGYLDDQYVGEFSDSEDGGRIADDGTGTYANNRNAGKTGPLYIEKEPTDYIDCMVLTREELIAGEADTVASINAITLAADWAKYKGFKAVVPERLLSVPTGSRGDVIQAGVWEDGVWTVEMKRALKTDNATEDVQFAGGNDFAFGLSLMDNAGGDEHWTTGGAVSTLRIGTITGVELAGEQVVPVDFSLNQNYPNPFNPETKITYQLPNAGDVRLAIYDIQGRLIRELVSSRQSPGAYDVVWDGRNNNGAQVASGIYFYCLKSGKYAAAKKMMLLR